VLALHSGCGTLQLTVPEQLSCPIVCVAFAGSARIPVVAECAFLCVCGTGSRQVSVPWRGRYQTESSPTDDCDLDVLIHEDRQWEPRGLPMEKSLKTRRAEENNACLKLLEQDFLEDPSEPRTLYHLGLHYKTAHEHHEDNTSAEAIVISTTPKRIQCWHSHVPSETQPCRLAVVHESET
jgi:hypothetical protein